MNNIIKKKIERLEALNRERDGLYAELKKSLALEALFPDAFAHGSPRSRVVGNPRRELTFTITLGNDEQRSLPLAEVPVTLWPEQVKADIRQLGLFHSRYHKLLTEGENNV